KPFEQQWGRSLPASPGTTAPEILAAAAEGRIRALWIASDHWLRSAPDRALAEKALERAELVIVSDLFLTETARRAHVVFAAAAFAEREGTSVNAERRIQRAARALSPLRGRRAGSGCSRAGRSSSRAACRTAPSCCRGWPRRRARSWAAATRSGLRSQMATRSNSRAQPGASGSRSRSTTRSRRAPCSC